MARLRTVILPFLDFVSLEKLVSRKIDDIIYIIVRQSNLLSRLM